MIGLGRNNQIVILVTYIRQSYLVAH